MDEYLLEEIIEQQNSLIDTSNFIKRELFEKIIDLTKVVIITGIKHTGKSTLLHQIRNKNTEKDNYIDFDNADLINFNYKDFKTLITLFEELYGKQATFYFDNIHFIDNWEVFVKKLHLNKNTIYLTVSSRTVISNKLEKHFFNKETLFPFTYKEYLNYYSTPIDSKEIELKQQFNKYITNGGFPRYLINKDKLVLKTLYQNIIYKEILVKNKLINEKEILALGIYILNNIGSTITYNKLKKVINVKHAQTIKNYIHYFMDSSLLFLVTKYDISIKKQRYNPRKMYFIDNGLLNYNRNKQQSDEYIFLENLVFLALNKTNFNIFYHKDKHKCTFLLQKDTIIKHAIQVAYSVKHYIFKEMEIKGLIEAMIKHNLDFGYILTHNDNEEEIFIKNKKIIILPIYKWLLKSKLLNTNE